MTDHRAHRRTGWASAVTSVRLRAALGLGVALGIGAVSTFAFWTDQAAIDAGTFTSATLNVKVNDLDSYASTSLAMPAMVPGSTSADVLVVKNVGTAPLKYTFTGGMSGTNAGDFNTAASNGLLLTIRLGGTKSGATCTGGTVVFAEAALTNVTTTVLLAKRPTTALAAANTSGTGGGTENLCVQRAQRHRADRAAGQDNLGELLGQCHVGHLMTQPVRLVREVFLTVAAVLGVVCIVATLAGLVLDVRPLVFRSGSMAPAIDTGALAVARTVDAKDLVPGDIVSVTTRSGERVTHRLVETAPDGSRHR
ncbi:S24/S26 family peptidase [Aeromicrobium sp. UC242_57]|uniref:S24/S26 family peptidase n=1 Tax=Aeromicrobium sp. UC242_57 TaxID=3374624 RepID=UPI0037BC189C